MHCTDCHFYQDSHGNTKLYGEVRAAIEIQCIDCHGTRRAIVDRQSREPARPAGQPAVADQPVPRRPTAARICWRCGRRSANRDSRSFASRASTPKLIQRSTVEPDLYVGGHANRRHRPAGSPAITTREPCRQNGPHGRPMDASTWGGNYGQTTCAGVPTTTKTCPASPATVRGTQAVSAVTCRRRPTSSRPNCTTSAT